jgi:ER lumen protein retaining receptor
VGISIKTQELYLLVFLTRYLDLFTTFYSFYNSIMKILYIFATAYVVYMVYGTEPFKTNYEKSHDSFLHWYFAVIPCLLLAIVTIVLEGFDFLEVSLPLIPPLPDLCVVLLDLFNLFRSIGNSSTINFVAKIS